MHGIQFTQFGGPEVLELVALPDPEPGPGQIRVAVRAAGVNPIDWKVRSGAMGGDLPKRTGQEVAGVVDKLGDGVRGVEVGEAVFGGAAGGGGAAELALLENYARVPASLDFAGAAALPVAVETAVRTLDLLGVGAGQTIVINGAVRQRRHRGRPVRPCPRGACDRHRERCQPGLPTRVRGRAHHLRRGVGGARPRAARRPRRGRSCARRLGRRRAPGAGRAHRRPRTGWSRSPTTRAPSRRGSGSPAAPGASARGTRWRTSPTLIEEGRFRLPVAQTFPLADIAEAHRISESGHPGGKLVLIVSEG